MRAAAFHSAPAANVAAAGLPVRFRSLPRLPARRLLPAGNHVRVMGDQASERFEKKWAMSAIEVHWEHHMKACQLEDAVRACCVQQGCAGGRADAGTATSCATARERTCAAPGPSCSASVSLAPLPPPVLTLCAVCCCPPLQQLEAETQSLPDKLQAVTAELQELTRKVRRCRGGLAWVDGWRRRGAAAGWQHMLLAKRTPRDAGAAACNACLLPHGLPALACATSDPRCHNLPPPACRLRRTSSRPRQALVGK